MHPDMLPTTEFKLEKIKLNADIESVDDVDMCLLRMKHLEKVIVTQEAAYKVALTELNDEFSDLRDAKDELQDIKKNLEAFAVKDRDIWENDTLKLENGILQFTEGKGAGSLIIEKSVEELAVSMKKYFTDDPKYYLNYIAIKMEPKKNEIKTAIKSGLLTEEFCKENGLEIKPTEKFEIKYL